MHESGSRGTAGSSLDTQNVVWIPTSWSQGPPNKVQVSGAALTRLPRQNNDWTLGRSGRTLTCVAGYQVSEETLPRTRWTRSP